MVTEEILSTINFTDNATDKSGLDQIIGTERQNQLFMNKTSAKKIIPKTPVSYMKMVYELNKKTPQTAATRREGSVDRITKVLKRVNTMNLRKH